MANTSIYAAFERMWQHIVNALGKKSDLNHNHTASDIVDLEEQLEEISHMKPNIVLPAGRAKGDINGDGSTNSKDATFIMQYYSGDNIAWELSDIDLWAADVNDDGEITKEDYDAVLAYTVENFDDCPDTLSDYYGNWIWDNVKHCYYYDATVEDTTTLHSAIIFIDKIMEYPTIIDAECMDGFIRIYADGIPTSDINCTIIRSFGSGKTIIVDSQNMFDFSEKLDETLTKEGFAADARATGNAITNLSTLVGNIPVSEQIAEAIVDVYVQDEEPIDAPDGSIWVDTDADGASNVSGKKSANVYVVDARTSDLTTIDFSQYAIGDVVIVTTS